MTTQITSPNIEPTFLATLATLTGSQTLTNKTIQQAKEVVTITSAAPSATTNFDVVSQCVQYYISNTTENFVLNVRGNSSTTLNSLMAVGESISIALFVTNSSPAYYPTSFTVDGTSITPKVQGGTAITSGNPNSVDVYTLVLVKNGNNSYYSFVSQTKFA